MQCGQNVQLLNVKLLEHHVTGRVQKVNEDIYAEIQYVSANVSLSGLCCK